jgi:putative membrane protein
VVKQFLPFGPKFEIKEDIILRDYLALERTRLANERTLMSYLRTSLYLLLGGIAFLQLEGFDTIKWIGHLSLALSILILVIGFFRFFRLQKRLKGYYDFSAKQTLAKPESRPAD